MPAATLIRARPARSSASKPADPAPAGGPTLAVPYRSAFAEREGPAHPGVGQALPDGGRGPARGLARYRGRGVLWAAGPERCREVDPDPLHDRAGATDLGSDQCLR